MSSLVSKLSSLFDARFAVGYLAPASVAAGALALIVAAEHGFLKVVAAWKALKAAPTVSGGITIAIALLVLAYLLQSVTTPMLQLWEGHYLPEWLARRWRASHRRAADRLAAEMELLDKKVAHPVRYFGYPRDAKRFRPTRLGNALAAAEEYASQTYGIDGILWWPRLKVVLPTEFRRQLDDGLVPIVGLLNLGTVLLVSLLGAGVVLLLSGETWFWLPPVIGSIAAWACYRGAVGHAVNYGTLVRVAFDFHRMDILKRMSIRIPESYEVERALWGRLNRWIHTFTPPDEGSGPEDPEWMRKPFAYAAVDSDD